MRYLRQASVYERDEEIQTLQKHLVQSQISQVVLLHGYSSAGKPLLPTLYTRRRQQQQQQPQQQQKNGGHEEEEEERCLLVPRKHYNQPSVGITLTQPFITATTAATTTTNHTIINNRTTPNTITIPEVFFLVFGLVLLYRGTGPSMGSSCPTTCQRPKQNDWFVPIISGPTTPLKSYRRTDSRRERQCEVYFRRIYCSLCKRQANASTSNDTASSQQQQQQQQQQQKQRPHHHQQSHHQHHHSP